MAHNLSKESQITKISKIISIVTTVLAVFTAGVLIFQTVDIYRTAGSPMYTASVIAEHLKPVLFLIVPLILCILVNAFLPTDMTIGMHEKKSMKNSEKVVSGISPESKKRIDVSAEKAGLSHGSPKRQRLIRGVLAAAAVFFLIVGILNGGMYDVLVKAINICTECIGLG